MPSRPKGRVGRNSLATVVVIALVCFLGLTVLLLAVIPLVAILPILLFVGLVIGARTFQVSPKRHAPTVVLAIFGFIHGVQLSFAVSPVVALGYTLMAGICFFFAWLEEAATGSGGWQLPADDGEYDVEIG